MADPPLTQPTLTLAYPTRALERLAAAAPDEQARIHAVLLGGNLELEHAGSLAVGLRHGNTLWMVSSTSGASYWVVIDGPLVVELTGQQRYAVRTEDEHSRIIREAYVPPHITTVVDAARSVVMARLTKRRLIL